LIARLLVVEKNKAAIIILYLYFQYYERRQKLNHRTFHSETAPLIYFTDYSSSS